MSSRLARLQLKKAVNKIKRKSGEAAMAEVLGNEMGSIISAYGKGTAENRQANKAVATAGKDLGLDMGEKNLSPFQNPKDFLSNWGNKLNLTGPKDTNYTSKEGTSYSTQELKTYGRLKNSKNPIVQMTLGNMEKQGNPLSSMFGTKEGDVSIPKEPSNLEFNPKPKRSMSSILNTKEFGIGNVDDRTEMLKNNSTEKPIEVPKVEVNTKDSNVESTDDVSNAYNINEQSGFQFHQDDDMLNMALGRRNGGY